MARPKSQWQTAHVRLKRLYGARIEPVMSQKEFARLHGFGSQATVAQYLTGVIPLNYDAAAKFAKAMGCTITEICPEMANTLAYDIFPVLGKVLRRAALLVLALQFGGQPSDANAASHNAFSGEQQSGKNLTKSGTYYTFWAFLFRILNLSFGRIVQFRTFA